MEDTYRAVWNVNGDSLSAFYGVFDGHGGERASTFSAKFMFSTLSKESLFRNPGHALKRGYQQVSSLLALHDCTVYQVGDHLCSLQTTLIVVVGFRLFCAAFAQLSA